MKYVLFYDAYFESSIYVCDIDIYDSGFMTQVHPLCTGSIDITRIYISYHMYIYLTVYIYNTHKVVLYTSSKGDAAKFIQEVNLS